MVKIVLEKQEELEKFWMFLKNNFPQTSIEINIENGHSLATDRETVPFRQQPIQVSLPQLKSKFPTRQEVENFILAQPNYIHTIHQVATALMGRKLRYDSSKPETQKDYSRLWIILDHARKRIAFRLNGSWSKQKSGEYKFGMPMIYTFVKKQ